MTLRMRTILMGGMLMLACPLASSAQDAAAGPKRPQPDMQAMDKVFRALNAQVKDPAQNAASLAAVAQLQAATVAAKDGVPPLVAALPEAERPARMVEYKKEMDNLLHQEITLEEQLLAGDNAKAVETLAAMQATQQEGHRGFRPQRGRGPGGGGAPGGRGGAAPPTP